MLLLALAYAKVIFKASCKKQYMRLNYQVLHFTTLKTMSALATLLWNNNSEGGLENKTRANTFSLIKEVFKLYLLTDTAKQFKPSSFPSLPTLSQTPEFTPFLSITCC